MIKVLGNIPKGEFGLACSGGVDSMAIANFLLNGGYYPNILYFNHNTENAQKNLNKEKKLDSLNQIKKDITAINANANKKSNPVRETLDIFQTFTQKIARFFLKQKAKLCKSPTNK